MTPQSRKRPDAPYHLAIVWSAVKLIRIKFRVGSLSGKSASWEKQLTDYQFVVADDHPLFRDALKQTLAVMFPGSDLKVAGSLDELSATVEANEDIDLILLDLKMPGVKGFSGLIYLRAQFPNIPVVVVSANEEPQVIHRALDLGASGYIPKSSSLSLISDALKKVLDGEIVVPQDIDLETAGDAVIEAIIERLASLTPQQVRVLMMLQEGLLNKQIAYELEVSEATVKAHVSAILQKLQVESRTQAVIAANRVGDALSANTGP